MPSTLDAPRSRLWHIFTALLPYAALILIFGVMGLRDLFLPQAIFLNGQNISVMVVDCVPTIIAAAGMTLIILTGGIDLSVGSIMGVAAAIACLCANKFQQAWMGMLIGVAAGMVCGFLNGLMTIGLRVQPFIVTLGSLMALRGVCDLLCGKGTASVNLGDGIKDPQVASAVTGQFIWIAGKIQPLGIPRAIPLAAAVVLFLWVLCNHTRLGRRLYAVGSNEEAARLSGVNVGMTKLAAYSISGAMAGIAGILYAARLRGSTVNTGEREELTVIASVVIGGTSLFGGQGNVLGCVIGAVLMRALSSACTSLRIEHAWQLVISGLFLIAAAALDRLRREKAR